MRRERPRLWPLRPVALAGALLLGSLAVPSVAAAETIDDLVADLRSLGYTCESLTGAADAVLCERETGASVIDHDFVALRPGGTEVTSSSLQEPWAPDLEAIAIRAAEVACPGAGARAAALVTSARAVPAPNTVEEMVGACRMRIFTNEIDIDGVYGDKVDRSVALWVHTLEGSGVLPSGTASAIPLPSLVASSPPVASPPVASPSAGAGGAAPGGPLPAFGTSVPRPAEVVTESATVAASVLLTLLAILLVPFPGALFNSTLETHHDEIRGWFRGRRRRSPPATVEPLRPRRSFWASPAGVATFLVVSAVLYGFLDPGFGQGVSSVPMFIGTLLGLALITGLAVLGPWRAHARQGIEGRLRALPLTLAVAVVCVAISRLTGFLPGYLYGLLITVEFARGLDGRDQGRIAALGAGFLLGVAGVAWFALGLLPPDDSSPLLAVVSTALTSVVVAGLEGVVFGLVPLRFLPGSVVFAWSRPIWAALYGLGVFGFLHVLMNPEGGYLASSARTPLFTIVALLVGFGALSIAFWGYFRFRPERAARESDRLPPHEG